VRFDHEALSELLQKRCLADLAGSSNGEHSGGSRIKGGEDGRYALEWRSRQRA